jgi:trans-aconitate methyltransferase
MRRREYAPMHPSAKQIVDLYERHAAAFDRARGRERLEKAWLDRFRALIAPGASVLDIGCGSGEPIAGYLIQCGHCLTGVDSAPSLVALAASRFPGHTWAVGDMRRLDLGRRFAGLVAWDSFFHLDHANQRAMFPRFAAHALPEASLLFTSGPSHGEAVGTFEGEALYHASLSPDEYEQLLADNGFRVVSHAVEDADCGGHTVWLAQAAAALHK